MLHGKKREEGGLEETAGHISIYSYLGCGLFAAPWPEGPGKDKNPPGTVRVGR